MATDIVIPTVGESVNEGVIAAWTKGDGEWVDRDETIIELETDKITMEIPAPAAGVLKHGAAEGDTVEVGATVGSVDESAEKPAGGDGSASAGSASAGSGEKASAEGGSESKGTDGGSSTAVAEKPAESKPSEAKKDAAGSGGSSGGSSASSGGKPASNGDVHATPVAKKLADEQSIDLHNVAGTGPGGRIREQDVLAAMRSVGSAASRRGGVDWCRTRR